MKQDRKVPKAVKATPVSKVRQELKALKVPRVTPDNKDRKVTPDHKVPKATQDHKVPKARQVHKAHKDPLALRAPPVVIPACLLI